MKSKLRYKRHEQYYCDRFFYVKHDVRENRLNGFGITFSEFLQCQLERPVSLLVFKHLDLLTSILHNIGNGLFMLDESGIKRIISENIECDADLMCANLSPDFDVMGNVENILSMQNQIVHLENIQTFINQINSLFLHYAHDDYENCITFTEGYDVAMFVESIIYLKLKNKLQMRAIKGARKLMPKGSIKTINGTESLYLPSYFHSDNLKEKIEKGFLIDFDSIDIRNRSISCYEIEIAQSQYDYADVVALIDKRQPIKIGFRIG